MVSFSADEYERVKVNADRLGLSVASFVRMAAVQYGRQAHSVQAAAVQPAASPEQPAVTVQDADDAPGAKARALLRRMGQDPDKPKSVPVARVPNRDEDRAKLLEKHKPDGL